MSKKNPRRKGEGAIYQRSDGLYCCAVELPAGLDGKRRRKVICRKDPEAVTKALRAEQAKLEKHGNVPTNSPTVNEWLTHWLDDIASQKVRPRTLAGHRTVAVNHIIPALGKKRLDKLTAEDVRKMHKRIMSTPKDASLRGTTSIPRGTEMLSSTYALLAHNVLSAALKTALREGRINSNPCDMVDRPRKRVVEQKALDAPQAIQLLKHLALALDGEDGQAKQDAAMWATYLLTGARRGEILGLEAERITDRLDLSWQLQRIGDIDNVPQDFEYRKLVGKSLYLTRPKSRAGWRVVPLVEPLRSILAQHLDGRQSGLVFTRGGRPWDPDRATKEWKNLLIEAGLPTDVVLHGTRHTTVDLLYEAGVPEAVISEIVGHSSRAVTRGYKSRGNSKQLADAMGRMSELLGVTQ